MAIEVKGDNAELKSSVEEYIIGIGGCLVDYDIGVCGWEIVGISDTKLLSMVREQFGETITITTGNMYSASYITCNS